MHHPPPGRSAVPALAVVLLLAACGGGSEEDGGDGSFSGQTLVVTSYGGGWEELMRAEVVPGFEELTGATVELEVGISTDFVTQMRVAGPDDPPYDVVITNETYVADLRASGYFAELTVESIPTIAEVDQRLRDADPSGTSVLSMFNPIGIAYRTDLVTQPPDSFAGLTGGGFALPVGIFNVSSTPGPMLTLTLAEALTGSAENWQAGFEAVRGICPVREAGSVGDLTSLLVEGTVGVATHDIAAVARLVDEGEPVAWQLPAEGVFAYDQNINVPAGSDQPELAFAFVDYWLSAGVQESWTEEYFYHPANTNVEPAAGLTELVPEGVDLFEELITFDWQWFNEGPDDELADRWNREGPSC
jgi:putative spermidine/putrescine transport system substrate-binding protein